MKKETWCGGMLKTPSPSDGGHAGGLLPGLRPILTGALMLRPVPSLGCPDVNFLKPALISNEWDA